ncbi:hypothetical protein AAZX31_10G203400 [Glycine max]
MLNRRRWERRILIIHLVARVVLIATPDPVGSMRIIRKQPVF